MGWKLYTYRRPFGLTFGHTSIGYFGFGSRVWSYRFEIHGGLWPRADANLGEIAWRWWFSFAPGRGVPRPLYLIEGGLSERWTGRDRRLIGYRWLGYQHTPWA